MATKAPPIIPPRPSRSSNNNPVPSNTDAPKVPPRPSKRPAERPVSPRCDSYAPSPLNALPGEMFSGRERLSRPPSVSALPSVGQEGMEYETIGYQNEKDDKAGDSIQQPAETRSINQDLYLHAPRPSLPGASAKAQVEVVTRTDSRQAAAAGFGAPIHSNDDDRSLSPSKVSRSQSRLSGEHRKSALLGDEHGIPEIGRRVPMIPNAGDVQAPTPAPPGVNDELPRCESRGSHRLGRQQSRAQVGRESSLPPGSYGLHGHGIHSNDKFEKAWYDKHPDEFVREEQNHYGMGFASPRPEWAMSSDDLNKIVKSSAARAVTLGATADVMGTPDEEIGYLATEELASRLVSPMHGSGIRPEVQPFADATKSQVKSNLPPTGGQDTILNSARDHDKEGVQIHIDEPIHHQNHPDGFMPAPEDNKPHGDDSLEESEANAPILAEDEVDERTEHLQPAVSPTFERRDGLRAVDEFDLKGNSRSASTVGSRPHSKPAASPVLSRYNSRAEDSSDMRRPLEDVEEYEPLFPEDDKDEKEPSVDEKLRKRPEFHQHRFPSRDIWEDVPDSLQLQTTVSIPESPKNETSSPVDIPENKMAKIITQTRPIPNTSSSGFDSRVSTHDVKQRFPSKDIWEEAPESHQLEATVQTPEQEQVLTTDSAQQSSMPEIPHPPSQKAPEIVSKLEPSSAKTESALPAADLKKRPILPERPKPQIPPRPARPPKRISDDSLTKTISNSPSDTAQVPPVVKPKPPVPSRPLGSKIAALKAGFLSDLDNRLKLGPQAPKPQEKEEEQTLEAPKGPLSDARKGRARGPARRKPAVSSIPEETMKTREPETPSIMLVEPWNIWSMTPNGVFALSKIKSRELRTKTEVSLSSPDQNDQQVMESRVEEKNALASLGIADHISDVQEEASKPFDEPRQSVENMASSNPAPVVEPSKSIASPVADTVDISTDTTETPEARGVDGAVSGVPQKDDDSSVLKTEPTLPDDVPKS
ncbi:hypothetical protein LOZ12_000113 [Ophidiomyces ophidiicola]|uniref:Uncharacterized protein n=1 Tax=Ophidiomyces ophidiicola TaxID=1387563 RepID=A0ACB8V5K4_9EURO|nr:uncharacterized protein LOZ57_003103 [Ophidiomyces ophidiicola]KAI1923653.1 hypothetical protein LOZ64_000912 [Ophidiomyces ophidiicola]KAI1947951.1 hypothetical protein LOZ57_003103 [Ophidiomyces ophidiicola]KAI1956095.1 hypothetical protein LOZ62_000087 [Ophidiomyces ophidiicola]KAI1967778.1 hypothetical protein LOZ59_000593 [Ophidiomyces ophidiicola]KAI1975229.1 hypothetical protein LOZ56_000753 [Ophidiomyces ophidiicola]